jgi:hypothetical protein
MRWKVIPTRLRTYLEPGNFLIFFVPIVSDTEHWGLPLFLSYRKNWNGLRSHALGPEIG